MWIIKKSLKMFKVKINLKKGNLKMPKTMNALISSIFKFRFFLKMPKTMNAVFICRDDLENKDSFYGFVIYEGDNSVVKEIYEKVKQKIGFIENNENELTLCQIQKMKEEFQSTRKILSDLYGFEVSEIKSQKYNDWQFDGFAEGYTREEFDKMQEQAMFDDAEEG